MNHGPLIFLGILFTLALSWCGLVFAPQIQLGRQEVVNATGQLYPPNRPGLAQQGGEVYRANGCQYCHSQQVQPKGLELTSSAAGANDIAWRRITCATFR